MTSKKVELPPEIIDRLCASIQNAKIKTARKLVDRCAAHPDNKSMEDVGIRIAETLKKEHPGNEEMLMLAVKYMTEKAVHQGCGPDADHDCPWKNNE